MKTKRWQVVSIVSLALIVVEVALFLLLAMPAMRTNKLFKSIEACDKREAADVYDSLSDGAKDRFQKKLDDFGTYQVNQYIDGKLEYEKVRDILDTASSLDNRDCPTLIAPYKDKADTLELIRLYEEGVQEYKRSEDVNSHKYNAAYTAYKEIYNAMENPSVADGELYDYFDARYSEYNSGKIDVCAMAAYADTGEYFFSYSSKAYELASEVATDMYYIQMYQENLDEAQKMYDEEDYFGCVDYCDNELTWTFTDDDETGYRDKFQALRDEAYEAGKDYYLAKAEELINSGDVEGGQEILTKMDEMYGDDVDTSEVWALAKPAWMGAYVKYMKDWETNVPADMASGVKIGEYDDPTLLNYDDYKPSDLYLYDVDENGVPEMLLRGEDYHYFIYTYDGNNVVFTGMISLVSLCETSKMLTEPITCPDGFEGYELLRFENNGWVVEEYYITDGSSYEVNGNPATREEAEALHNKFKEMDNATYLSSADVNDCEDFIYDYEAE